MPTVEELQAALAEAEAKRKEEIDNAKKLRERAQKAEAALAEANGAKEALEAAKIKAEQDAQRANLESKGKYEEALKLANEQAAKAIAEREAHAKALQDALHQQVGQSALLAALGKAGVQSNLIDQAAKLVAGQVKVELRDGKPVVVALDDKGQPVDSIDTLAAAFAKSNPHFLPPSGGGSGGTPGGGATGGVTLAQLDSDAVAKGEFIRKDPVAYQKLVAADLAAKRAALNQPQKKG